MATETNLVAFDDFDSQLARVGLSRTRASRITGISRRTLEKIANGEGVRPLTAHRLVTSLKREGFELVQGEGSNIEFHPNSRSGHPSVIELVNLAAEYAEQVDSHLQELLKRHYGKESGFENVDFDTLLYQCREIQSHSSEIAGVLGYKSQK